MGIRDDKIKNCGCIIFTVGPPVLCEKHQRKQDKRELKEQRNQEKGLRKAAAEAAEQLGHELTKFTEYGAADQPGKWTAFCSKCGDIVIYYEKIEQAPGDQVCGRPLTEQCRRSNLVGGLAGL